MFKVKQQISYNVNPIKNILNPMVDKYEQFPSIKKIFLQLNVT